MKRENGQREKKIIHRDRAEQFMYTHRHGFLKYNIISIIYKYIYIYIQAFAGDAVCVFPFEWKRERKFQRAVYPMAQTETQNKNEIHTHIHTDRERERNRHVTTFYPLKKLKKEVTSQSNRRQRGLWPDKTMQ